MKMKTAMMLACFIPLKIPFLGTKEKGSWLPGNHEIYFRRNLQAQHCWAYTTLFNMGYKLGYYFIYNFSWILYILLRR